MVQINIYDKLDNKCCVQRWKRKLIMASRKKNILRQQLNESIRNMLIQREKHVIINQLSRLYVPTFLFHFHFDHPFRLEENIKSLFVSKYIQAVIMNMNCIAK